jgi:hypothetical protein
MISESLSSLRWESVHKPMRTVSEYLLGRQEWANPMGHEGRQRGCWVLRGVIVTSYIA